MSRNPDLIGRQFGRLTVRARAGSSKDVWVLDCSCGGTLVASTSEFADGGRWHCDDCQPEHLDNLVGKRFGLLTVRSFAGSWKDSPDRGSSRHWELDCSCGGQVTASTAELTSGKRWHCADCQPEQKGVDYRVDYRAHLKTFTDNELRRLVAILRGRKSERDIAEAVDLVMRERSKTAA